MKRELSTDGVGGLRMIEEIDDLSDTHNDHTLYDVFAEGNEKGLIEKLDKYLGMMQLKGK